MTDFAALRRNMVDCQLRTYDVIDRGVLGAMDAVPREAFVPASRRELAYLDQPAPLDELGAAGRALLTPMVAARMLQTCALKPGQSFMEYAGGTGYLAAAARALGARAVLVEGSAALRQAAEAALEAAGAADVAVMDAPPAGAFDVILVSGACEARPESLLALLADGGRLVAIEGLGRSGRVMLYRKTGDVVSGRPVFDAAGPAIADFLAKPAFAL